MKVSIKHGEMTKGIISKKTYQTVTIHVDFTNEELAIIKARQMGKLVVIERPWPANNKNPGVTMTLTVNSLVSGALDEHIVDTPLEAKQYEAMVVGQLKLLKEELEANASGGEDKSFEL